MKIADNCRQNADASVGSYKQGGERQKSKSPTTRRGVWFLWRFHGSATPVGVFIFLLYPLCTNAYKRRQGCRHLSAFVGDYPAGAA
jgi:hypothetical protein